MKEIKSTNSIVANAMAARNARDEYDMSDKDVLGVQATIDHMIRDAKAKLGKELDDYLRAAKTGASVKSARILDKLFADGRRKAGV